MGEEIPPPFRVILAVPMALISGNVQPTKRTIILSLPLYACSNSGSEGRLDMIVTSILGRSRIRRVWGKRVPAVRDRG